jgi:hypothetical protein
MHDRTDHLFSARFEESLDRAPRHAHAISGALLIEAFQIAKPQSFELVVPEVDDFQIPYGYASGLEDLITFIASAVPMFPGSGHGSFSSSYDTSRASGR